MTTTEGQPLLGEVLGAEQGGKQRANKALGAIQRLLASGPKFNGLAKTYTPVDEDDLDIPASTDVRVEYQAEDVLTQVRGIMVDLWDVVFTRESGNTEAKADIVVGETVVARDVPVTYLLFLGKQLDDLYTILSSVPRLDPIREWDWDENAGLYRSKVTTTARTRKEPYVLELAPATDKHPRQVQVISVDKVVGHTERIDFSGALKGDRVRQLLTRVEALRRAVRAARERANATPVQPLRIGDQLFDYVFAP